MDILVARDQNFMRTVSIVCLEDAREASMTYPEGSKKPISMRPSEQSRGRPSVAGVIYRLSLPLVRLHSLAAVARQPRTSARPGRGQSHRILAAYTNGASGLLTS